MALSLSALFRRSAVEKPSAEITLDILRAIGKDKNKTSGSISRKLRVNRKIVESNLERMKSAGQVGCTPDKSWFLTSLGLKVLISQGEE